MPCRSHLMVLGAWLTGIGNWRRCYRRFGSRVTIIDPGPQMMNREDPDVAAEMLRILNDEGDRDPSERNARSLRGSMGEAVTATARMPTGERTIEGSHVLVAVGRIANTAGIGLEEAGIALDARGFIQVNDRLETTARSVWAIGECAGSPQFTHVSVDDFRIIRDNLGGGHRSTKDRLVPYCVFTDPPLSHVGLSESEAQRQGIPVRVAKLPMSHVRRTEERTRRKG